MHEYSTQPNDGPLSGDSIMSIEDDDLMEGSNGIKASDMQVGGSHYKTMEIQPSAFIVQNSLGWYEGNAVKYICRHHAKGGRADINKAIHYLNLLLEQEYGNE